MRQNYMMLDWDSQFFEYRIARFAGARTTRDELERVVAACRQDRVECLYFLADADHSETVEALESQGFGLKDIRMTYRYESVLPRNALQTRGLPVLIRPVQTNEILKLEAIARVSHTDSRFYFDQHFSRERADDMYQTWIRKSCEGGADMVLVAEGNKPGAPNGYITCLLSGTAGEIGLVAVDERARGQGIGFQLVHAALQWFALQDVKHVQVVTQGRNIGAQRLYQQAGFTLRSMQLWYHGWFDRSS